MSPIKKKPLKYQSRHLKTCMSMKQQWHSPIWRRNGDLDAVTMIGIPAVICKCHFTAGIYQGLI